MGLDFEKCVYQYETNILPTNGFSWLNLRCVNDNALRPLIASSSLGRNAAGRRSI